MHQSTDPIDHAFPGEDRNWGGSVLYVDLIPQGCWFTNARSVLSRDEWRDLARRVRARARQACEICGYDRTTLDVHERWQYLETNSRRIQKLIRLIALCKNCHGATHMGFAELQGRDAAMRAHLAKINMWSNERVMDHVERAFAVFYQRSRHLWDLDVTLLEAAGYHPEKPPSNAAREAIAIAQVEKQQRDNH